MMRSLFAGVAGLKNHQTRMDVIGNNIANVNTVGFKRGRVNFQEMLVQTLRGASSPQASRGGVNAMQVGLGVSTGSIDTIQTQGNLQSTGKNTDLAIQGDGFFVLLDDSGQVFTRSGVFDLDRDGNLINSSNGMKIMGWSADTTGKINTNSSLNAITIPIGQSMKPAATNSITFANNLDASAISGITAPHIASIEIYDSQGTAHTTNTAFSKTTTDNQWVYEVSLATSDPLIQKFINLYYPNYDTLTVDEQALVVEAAQKSVLEGNSTLSGICANGQAGICLTALNPTNAYNLTVNITSGGPTSATIGAGGTNPINISVNPGDTLQQVVDVINSSGVGAYFKASLDATVQGTQTAVVDTEAFQTLDGGTAYGGGYAMTNTLGANNLRVVANESGQAGNNIKVVMAGGGVGTATSATLSGTGSSTDPYIVTVAWDTTAGVNLNTISAAINGTADIAALISAVPQAGSGATAAVAAASTSLAGGVDSSRRGYVLFNSSGQLDADGTRALNGAISPDMTRQFTFKPETANEVRVTMDIKQLTQYTSAFTAVAQKQDGNPTGTLQSFAIDGTGKVSGIFSNGFSKELAILAVANFNNPGGLIKVGDNMFKRSNNSGLEQVGTAGTGGRGSITPGALEMSNVDLSQEFTDMITTQRGFQANSRIITTSDEMLQELVNLKR